MTRRDLIIRLHNELAQLVWNMVQDEERLGDSELVAMETFHAKLTAAWSEYLLSAPDTPGAEGTAREVAMQMGYVRPTTDCFGLSQISCVPKLWS